MKCTKFDKHACKDFLWILLARLKWTHRHTHTCTAAMFHQLRRKLREGIISAVLFKVGKLFSLSCIILVFRLQWIEKKCWHSGTNTNYARVRHLAFTWTSLRVIFPLQRSQSRAIQCTGRSFSTPTHDEWSWTISVDQLFASKLYFKFIY